MPLRQYGAGRRVRWIARTIRPQLVILPWLEYSAVIVAHRGAAAGLILAGLGLLLSVYGIAVIQNDIADASIDRANHRLDIPLAAGAVTQLQLTRLMIALTLISTLLAVTLGSAVLLWAAAYTFFGWAYSGPLNLKARGIWAVIILGTCYGFMPWVLGWLVVAAPVTPILIGAAVCSGIFAAGIIGLKDFKDESGDREAGKITLLVKYGPQVVQRVAVVATFVSYFGLIAAFAWTGSYAVAGLGAGLLVYSVMKLNNPALIAASGQYRGKYGQRVRLFFVVFVSVTYILALRY